MIDTISRDERLQEALNKWLNAKCVGTLQCCTGFGKTRIAINAIHTISAVRDSFRTIVVVPTHPLQELWEYILSENHVNNSQVLVVNTASTGLFECELLIIDEIHRVASELFSKIFKSISYKAILGLTATLERLDNKHVIIEQHCPIVDTVSLLEAQLNGWIAKYKDYVILLDVDDIETYKKYQYQFLLHFEFFNYSWEAVTNCLGKDGFKFRSLLRDTLCPEGTSTLKKKVFTDITYHATQCMKMTQAKKIFINNHPAKVKVAQRIIKARQDCKIITFSNNVKMAESIGMGGYVYTGKTAKKKGRMTLDEFKQSKTGILHAVSKVNEGLDVPGLSVAVMLGIDSSKIKRTQRIGRVIRREGDKQAEIFTLIINNTVEWEWFKKSSVSHNVIPTDLEGLEVILKGGEPIPYQRKIKDFVFRY